jgi:hypothetical protein
MTKRNALVDLTLVFGIWFCLAFSCSSGTRKTTSTGETTQPTTGTTSGGAPTEADVKEAIRRRVLESTPVNESPAVITFDGPIQIGYAKTVNYPDPETPSVVAYPIKMNYSVSGNHYIDWAFDLYLDKSGKWREGRQTGGHYFNRILPENR